MHARMAEMIEPRQAIGTASSPTQIYPKRVSLSALNHPDKLEVDNSCLFIPEISVKKLSPLLMMTSLLTITSIYLSCEFLYAHKTDRDNQIRTRVMTSASGKASVTQTAK